jgi:uncharacterized cofD-like protein
MTGRRGLRVVAFGGGTGVSTLLEGLLGLGSRVDPVAIVAVSDDGGSTGRIRLARGGPALGDLRDCLGALARPVAWRELLDHRFAGDDALGGHAIGNLLLSAALEREGSLSGALKLLQPLLRVRGRLLPSTDADVHLRARLADGRVVHGECALASVAGPVERVQLQPEVVPPAPGVLEAVEGAQLIVLGPGSLFSSVIASALPAGIARALARSSAPKILVQNLTTEHGQTDEMGSADHVRAVREHLGPRSVDAVLVHRWNGPPPPRAVVPEPRGLAALGVREFVAGVSTDKGRGRRHDPARLADALLRCARGLLDRHAALGSG